MRRIEGAMHDAGIATLIRVTHQVEEVEEVAREELQPGDRLIAVGGDGTVNRVGRALLERGIDTPLGVLPLGTGNDFARALGMPLNAERALAELVHARLESVDCGEVSWSGAAESGRSVFLNVAGVGFDAAVAADVRRYLAMPGVMPYVAAALKTLPQWSNVTARVQNDETGEVVMNDRFLLVTAGNGARSGGGFLLTPEAQIDDGVLDLCVVRRLPVWRALMLLPTALVGRHVKAPEVRMVRTTALTVHTDTDVPIHADGELLSSRARTVTFKLMPRRLRVLVPAKSDVGG